MDEIVDGQEQRAASVLETLPDNNASLGEDLGAELLAAGVPETDLAAILGDNAAIDLNDDANAVVDDEPFDIVAGIVESPDEFVLDPQVDEAFASILQSNGADDTDIQAVLALVDSDAAAADLAATTGIIANDEPETAEIADEGFDNAEATDGDAVDPELLADSLTQAGIEAQSGVAAGDEAENPTPTSGCAGMSQNIPSDDSTADDAAIGIDADGSIVGTDADAASNDLASDPNNMDWMAVGDSGLSKLGELVQAFEELVEETGDMFAMLPVNGCCTPCPNTSLNMAVNDMNMVSDLNSQMPDLDMDLDW